MISPISTPNAKNPAGHYAQGVAFNGLIFTSMQVAREKAENYSKVEFERQAEDVLRGMISVIEAGGGSVHTILKVTIFLEDLALWPMTNKVFEELFGDHRPARSMVGVTSINGGYQIGASAIAHRQG